MAQLKPANKAQIIATRAESYAELWAIDHGWRVLSRNYRARGTELDLLMARPGHLLIVEVKGRTDTANSLDRERSLLPFKKRQAIRRGAAQYLHRIHEAWQPYNWHAELWLVEVSRTGCALQRRVLINLDL